MTPADAARIALLPLPDFCAALLDDDPKLGSGQLREAWAECHDGAAPVKAEFKSARDRWAAARAGGDAEDEDVDLPIRARLEARLKQATILGDDRAMTAAINALARLQAAGLAENKAGGPGSEDWSLLSEAERSCLFALTAKLNSQELDAEAQWWIVFLARVEAAPVLEHPSRHPLPAEPRPARLGP